MWVLLGPVGLFLLAAVTRWPEIGLLAIVLVTSGLVDPERLPLFSVGPISFHVTDLILLYLLTLVLARAMVAHGFRLVRTPLDLPLIWFCLAILLGVGLALSQPSVGPNWVFRRTRPLVYYLSFFAVTNLIRDRRQLQRLVFGLFAIALLAALVIIIQVLNPSIRLVQAPSAELVTAGREYAGVVRTYMQAYWLVSLIFLVSVCSLIIGAKWIGPEMQFIQSGILAVGILLSFGRNLWLTMMLMLVLLILMVSWTERLRIARWGIAGLLAAALVLSLPGISFDRYVEAAWDRLVWGMQPETVAQDDSVQMRLTEMGYGIQSIVQSPLLGVGIGNYYRPPLPGEGAWGQEGLRWFIHNAYLWVLIDMGLVGLIPFIWMFASFLARGFSYWRKIVDRKQRALVLGNSLGILGLAISNLMAPSFVQDWSLAIFAVVMGINEVVYVQNEMPLASHSRRLG